MQPIEIFRTGRHTAMAGQTLTFSEAELTAMAAAYDPALHEAPIVVGHPSTDGPAYGWIGGLAVAGDRLQATPHSVDAAFAELVRAGRFKRVSASFYAPESPNNPAPGAYYLRHVGFLGAQPPAVKGLKPVSFAAQEEGVVEFADAWALGAVARLLRGLREWMIGSAGQEAADRVLPSYEIEGLAEQASMERAAEPAPTYSEPIASQETPTVTQAAPTERRDEAEAELARLRAQVASFAEREAQARIAEDAAFLERLQAEGRMLPANRALAAGLLARLDAGEAVSFAEGRAAETPRDALRALLAAQPVAVEFREIAGGDSVLRLPAAAIAEEIVAASVQYQEAQKAKGLTVSTIEAVRAVTEGAK